MKKKERTHILDRAYSSYQGKVHIPYITTKPRIFSDKGIYMNSVCAEHVVASRSDSTNSEPAKKNE